MMMILLNTDMGFIQVRKSFTYRNNVILHLGAEILHMQKKIYQGHTLSYTLTSADFLMLWMALENLLP